MTTKYLNDLGHRAHQNANKHGFNEGVTALMNICQNTGQANELQSLATARKLALIHAEVSEAVEADRNNRWAQLRSFQRMYPDNKETAFEDFIKDSFEDELADIIIRTAELAMSMGIDLQAHVEAKMAYNAGRPYKHGKDY